MQSLASLMSSTQNDIAPLDDFDGEDDGKDFKHSFYCLFNFLPQLPLTNYGVYLFRRQVLSSTFSR